MARLHDVVFDCQHPASLARFWASALDGYDVAPYDEAELARLREQGIDNPEDDVTVLVEQPGASPRLWFQRVPETKLVKNRLHLDLQCDDASAELIRLERIGAQVVLDRTADRLIVLSDPEGNEFCLIW
jgi:hypothetical protein